MRLFKRKQPQEITCDFLKLGEDDTVVIHLDKHLPRVQMERMVDRVKTAFPGRHVVLVDPGMRVSALRGEMLPAYDPKTQELLVVALPITKDLLRDVDTGVVARMVHDDVGTRAERLVREKAARYR